MFHYGRSNCLFYRFDALSWELQVKRQMVYPVSVSQLRSKFDDFLYAQIDDSGTGTLLSVVSALARLDVDPWEEAANLAQMPRENAAQRLASLITALPGGPLDHLESKTVATRLIALLPRRTSFAATPRETFPAGAALTNFHAVKWVILINLVFMAIAFGSQYFTANSQSSEQVGHVQAPMASTAVSKVPPPNFGK